MIKQATQTRKAQKQLTIIRRYAISKGNMAGSICNVVRSVKTVKGQQITNEYQVWTLRDGMMSCDCPAKTSYCQHKDLVEIEEMRRCNNIAPVNVHRGVEQEASLLEQVNAELAKVSASPAIAEELAATQARSLLPHSVDQLTYFVQLNRRSAEYRKQQLEAESKRRTSAPLNGNRGFQLCKSWAEIEAERAAKKVEKQVQEEKVA